MESLLIIALIAFLAWWLLEGRRNEAPAQPTGFQTVEVTPVGNVGPAELIAVAGPLQGRRFAVGSASGRPFVLGRDQTASLMVGGGTASRAHAAITIDSGHWRLYDMNSSNGTYLNGLQVSSAWLSDGDVIALGDSQLQFRTLPGQAPRASTVAPPSQATPSAPPDGLVIPGLENYAMSKIAEGGTARVYKGVPRGGGEPIAVKVLTHADPYIRDKFMQEAELLKHLRHPHILKELASGVTMGGVHYIVLEYCAHGSLHQQLVGRPLSEAFVIQVGVQTCAALDFTHQHGVIHRDIKPANLLFSSPQHLKVGDFGISRRTQTRSMTVHGTVLGTVAYMAPEQTRGEELGPRADIYSLGVVLYEMLAGRPPFSGEPTDVMAQHVNTAPLPLQGVSPGLAHSVMRALAKDPSRRHASARAFAEALGGATAPAMPTTPATAMRLVRMWPSGLGDIVLSSEVTELGRKLVDPQDGQVSRRHARILLQGNICWLEDLGSANGTWVNHQRVMERRVLRPGDQLQIGKGVFRLDAR